MKERSRIEHKTFKVKRYNSVFRPKLGLVNHTMRQNFLKLFSQVGDKVSGIVDSLYESAEDDSIDLFDNYCVLLEKDIILSRIDKIKLVPDEITVDLTLALLNNVMNRKCYEGLSDSTALWLSRLELKTMVEKA